MGASDNRVLIIIPAYNEQDSIGGVIEDVKGHMPEADIVVVNDGSTDDTSNVVRQKAVQHRGVILIDLPYNLGIGATVQTGYRYAVLHGYKVAVQVDGDGQHPAREIRKLIEPVLAGKTDLAVGSRFLGEGDYTPSVFRGSGIKIFASIVSSIVGSRVTDPTSGFRATGLRALKFLEEIYPEDYPEVEALVLLHKGGFVMMEVPVTMAVRQGGRSSITPGRSVYYMVKVMLAIFVDLLKKVD